MAIRNGKDSDAFTTAGIADAVTAALRRGKHRIDETLPLVEPPFFAPLLKPTMHGFVMGIALAGC